MVVVVIPGGFGSIVAGGPPVFGCSVAMKVAANVGLALFGPLMTFRHLLVQFRRAITRGRAIAR